MRNTTASLSAAGGTLLRTVVGVGHAMRIPVAVTLVALAGLDVRVTAIESSASTSVPTKTQTTNGVAVVAVVDIIIHFDATDGTPLEAKLTVPTGATGPIPVVFYLHGAGPRNYDNAIQYRDPDGQLGVYRYYDFHSHELARRGLAFFRMSKRGCTVEPAERPLVPERVCQGHAERPA